MAFAGIGLVQLLPQAPQFVLLLVVLTSQPLLTLPSQLAKPGLHVGEHTPLEQAVPPLALVQVTLQPPQWLVFVKMLVSQPLIGLPSQLPAPGLQPGTHAPAEHVVEPLGLMHLVLQTPQWSVLVCKFVSQPL